MHAAALVAGLAALALSSSLGGPRLSTALLSPESRYTDLSRDSCRDEPGPAQPEAAARPALRCPGLGGARVLVSTKAGGTALGFAWLSREAAEIVLDGTLVEPMLEWRGITTSKGFEPYAVLARTAPGSRAGEASRTVVIRFRPGEACIAGTAAGTGQMGLEAARELADERARTGDCDRLAALGDGS